jgi:hypothetical protein
MAASPCDDASYLLHILQPPLLLLLLLLLFFDTQMLHHTWYEERGYGSKPSIRDQCEMSASTHPADVISGEHCNTLHYNIL